jgi:hypothetical protein
MKKTTLGLRPLVLALAVAACVPAAAQELDVAAIHLRLTQMEDEMQALRALLAEHAQTTGTAAGGSPHATVATPAALAPATVSTSGASRPAVVPAATPTGAGSGRPAGTTFEFGGFIKFDAMTTTTSDGKIADGTPGRLFYFPGATPVAESGQAQRSTYSDLHAQFSRFSFATDTTTDNGNTIKAYIEADMYGGGSNAFAGNETITNTYALTLRHAYVRYGHWLAGQAWSNFQDTAALPDMVDFTGPSEGTVFNRQAQLRYTQGPWSFSVENPQTTVTPYLSRSARFNSGDNRLPDITARWLTQGDWGHFTVAGLARQFRNDADTAAGGALSVSGRFNLGQNDDIRYMVSGGSGIGRYLGFALASDTVLDADGDMHALRGYGGFVAWRHAFTPKLRGNLAYSVAAFDNDAMRTGGLVTRTSQSFRINMIYSPAPRFDVGGEISWAQRRLENGLEGDLQRIHTHVKYSF